MKPGRDMSCASFLLVSFGVVLLTLLLCFEPNTIQYKTHFSAPPPAEILQNLRLMIDGYRGGFARSLWGGLVFGMCALFFLSTGKVICDGLLRKAPGMASGQPFSVSEWLAVYYLIGSLAASLLWFALGSLGWVSVSVALLMGATGIALSAFFAIRGRFPSPARSIGKLAVTERALLCVIACLLVLFATTTVTQPLYHDSLITHVSLPTYFISEGRVTTNPYHFHSFLPHNTEMLVLWALLLRSEIAAALIIWGFLVAMVLLMFGFLRRHIGAGAAIASVPVMLSSYTLVHQSFMIKNDVPFYAFTMAHYFFAIEAMLRRPSDAQARRLALLSGIFCGGAIGHKLTAIPIAFFSALAFLLSDIYEARKNSAEKSLGWPWFLGAAAAACPWLARSFFETGNPIYPLFNDFFTAHQEKILQYTQGSILLNTARASELAAYFKYQFAGLHHPRPAWGPTLLYGLLSLSVLARKVPWPFRLWIGAALLSSLALLISTDVRYNIGLYAFITCLSFAFTYEYLMNGRWQRLIRWTAIGVPLFALFQVYYRQDLWSLFGTSALVLLSGHSRGSYYSDMDNRLADEVRWVTYVIDTRTAPEEGVLFAGVNYVFGLDNKLFFSSGFDKEFIVEAAKKTNDAASLKDHLLGLGVRHIIAHPSFFAQFKERPLSQLEVPESVLERIRALFSLHATLRFATPDRNLVWLTLNYKPDLPGAVLNPTDALNFPLMYIAEAKAQFLIGQLDTAQSMSEAALKTPMPYSNKLRALAVLAEVLDRKGLLESRKAEILAHLSGFQRRRWTHAAEHLYIGETYFRLKEYELALKYYQRSFESDPGRYDAANQIGRIFYMFGDLEKARRYFEASIKADPFYRDAGRNLRKLAREIRLRDAEPSL